MRIAIGLEPDNRLHVGHFGDSPLFAIFDWQEDTLDHVENRKNPYLDAEDETQHHGKMNKIRQLLHDCDVFIGRGFGMQSLKKLDKYAVKIWLTRAENRDQVLAALMEERPQEFQAFDVNTLKFKALEKF